MSVLVVVAIGAAALLILMNKARRPATPAMPPQVAYPVAPAPAPPPVSAPIPAAPVVPANPLHALSNSVEPYMVRHVQEGLAKYQATKWAEDMAAALATITGPPPAPKP